MENDNIVITGSNGFIGSAFLKAYSKYFHSITAIRRKDSKEDVERSMKGKDIVIHLAYDRFDLQENFNLLENLINGCRVNNIKRFIFISSFSVYDPSIQGTLTEHSAYSTLNDHYSFVKIGLEQRLKDFSNEADAPQIIVLQPGVVVGESGNWFLHAIKSVSTGLLRLPLSGKGLCNAIHVNDVCNVIYRSAVQYLPDPGVRFRKFLISARKAITWSDFYLAHSQFLHIPDPRLEPADDSAPFSTGKIKSILYRILFNPIGVRVLFLASGVLFRIKKQKTETSLDEAVRLGKVLPFFEPEGINRIVHRCQFTIDSSEATKAFGFEPGEFRL